jgi:hypothetical protein
MSREELLNEEYSIFSIYYDMLNTPINIDIKKIFEENIIPNIHNKPVYLIRFLKQNDIFKKLYDNSINENGIKYHATTIPSVIWNYGKMHFFYDALKISNNYCELFDNNKIAINNIMFITSKYIDNIADLKKDKNIFLITNSEMTNEYDTNDVNIINYDKYIINDIKYIKEKIKEYDKYNWKNRCGECFFNPNILYILNMLAETLNYKDLNYTGLRYTYPIGNMKYTEIKENVEQYVLLFDYEMTIKNST